MEEARDIEGAVRNGRKDFDEGRAKKCKLKFPTAREGSRGRFRLIT